MRASREVIKTTDLIRIIKNGKYRVISAADVEQNTQRKNVRHLNRNVEDVDVCLCMYVGKNIVTVISLLINHMKDRVSRLSSRGVNSISLLAADIKKVESEIFSIVYESYDGEAKRRNSNISRRFKMSSSTLPYLSIFKRRPNKLHLHLHQRERTYTCPLKL